MSRNYDNWERIVQAVLKREQYRQLAYASSRSSDSSSISSSTVSDYDNDISRSELYQNRFMAWQKGELLGRGSFATVYEGINEDGFFFTVKEVSLLHKRDEEKISIIQLEQEIALLSQFEHENIVQYYGTEKVESHLYIFLELVTKGSLLSLYQKNNLRDSQVSDYTRQILHGLKYLHDKNVVHRNIKCANIMVDANGLVKLADFGLAKATKWNDVKSCKRTAFWMAPEEVRSQGYGLAADIWSLGCTILEMLTRCFPYFNLEPMSAIYRIGRGERPPIPNSLSCYARDFILKCLQVDANARPTASELLDHPFVKRSFPASSRGSSFSSISSSYRFGPGSPFHGQNIHEASSTVNSRSGSNDIEDLRFSNSRSGSNMSISRGDDDSLVKLSKRLENSARISNLDFSNNANVKLGEICRNGIKGVRPPVLALPPLMSLPVIDNECSTWDILKSFAPDGDKRFSRLERGFGSEDDEQETEVADGRRDDNVENFMRMFVDRTYPNIFREVNNAKWKAFKSVWRRMRLGVSRTISSRIAMATSRSGPSPRRGKKARTRLEFFFAGRFWARAKPDKARPRK